MYYKKEFKKQEIKPVKKRQRIEIVYSFDSKIGQHTNSQIKVNQDAIIIAPYIGRGAETHLFGVADGHGMYGEKVSALIKQMLPIHFEKENAVKKPETEALKETFNQTLKEITNSKIDIRFR